jgi:hypothetical protein
MSSLTPAETQLKAFLEEGLEPFHNKCSSLSLATLARIIVDKSFELGFIAPHEEPQHRGHVQITIVHLTASLAAVNVAGQEGVFCDTRQDPGLTLEGMFQLLCDGEHILAEACRHIAAEQHRENMDLADEISALAVQQVVANLMGGAGGHGGDGARGQGSGYFLRPRKR